MGTQSHPRAPKSSAAKSAPPQTPPPSGLTPLQNCSACAKEFRSGERLLRHQRSASCLPPAGGAPAYSCWLETCEKRFTQAAHLANHRLFHADGRRYACPSCYARFHLPESFSLHLTLVHAQVKKGTAFH